MSDDLVARLRYWAGGAQTVPALLMVEAADRIEALESHELNVAWMQARHSAWFNQHQDPT